MDNTSTLTSPSGSKKLGKPTTSVLPQVKGPEFNVRDQLNDILVGEKHLSSTYNQSLVEAVQPGLRKMLGELRDRALDCHWQVFTAMFDMGEYEADLASSAQIQDAADVFTGYRTQLPYDAAGSPRTQ